MGIRSVYPDWKYEKKHKWGAEGERRVAVMIATAGLDIRVATKPLRPKYKDRHKYKDGGVDGWIGPYAISIKRRDLNFTTPENFPFKTVIVEEKYSWDKASPTPCFVIVVNSDMTTAIVASSKAEHRRQWIATKRFNSNQKKMVEYYETPVDLCMTLSEFIRKCKDHKEMLRPGQATMRLNGGANGDAN